MFDRPVEERVAAGSAIAGAQFVSLSGGEDGAELVLRCARNQSRFRPGTRVRLSRGDPRKAVARLELVEDRFDGKGYLLRLSGAVEEPKALEGGEPWVLDEDSFDLLDAQLSILHAAQEGGLGSWLGGTEEPAAPRPAPGGSRFAEGLNGTMASAFAACAAERPYFAVQGPPGSGKTHLLARLALHFALEENKRVLVTAVSHQAIHNALGETVWAGRRLAGGSGAAEDLLADGVLKLGFSRGANEGLPEGVRAAFRLHARKRPVIAGATVYAALQLSAGFSQRPFDVALFDEAGQAPLLLGLAARLLARKAIFIGDDMQLPPVVALPPDAEVDPLGRLSVIGFLRRDYEAPLLLTRTRRLNRELCGVVSDLFYGGELEPEPDAAERRLTLAREPAPGLREPLDPDRPLVFIDVPHEGQKSACEEEARWAAAVAAEAVRCGIAPQEVGVIAPYRAQCNRIRFLLGRGAPVTVATVERFQGQERELVVISLTSSDRRYLARLAGFLFSPNRLNVAVSRARTKVILIGSAKALERTAAEGEESEPDAPFAAGFGAFRRLLAAAHRVDGARVPPPEAALLPAAAASDGALGEAFEPGELVDHPRFGAGRVLAKSAQLVDGRRRWINEIKFEDGKIRVVVPSLSRPPMRRID